MKIVSTNTGIPREFKYKDQTVMSSFFRTPQKAIKINFDKVEGDEFAGKNIHGVKESVVYAYSRNALQDLAKIFQKEVGIGQVGENLTVDELFEKDFCVGDVYAVGTCEIKATSPRYPCNRFNLCFQGEQYQKLFEGFNRPGVYFEVIKPGEVKPGDSFKLIKRGASQFTVLDQYHFLFQIRHDQAKLDLKLLTKIMNDPEMTDFYKRRFKARFAELST